MKWTQIVLDVNEESAQPVCDMLYDIGIESVEIIDHHLSKEEIKALFIDYIEEQVLANKNMQIKCYVSDEEPIQKILENIMNGLKRLNEFVPTQNITVSTAETNEENWANNWKNYYKPFKIGKNIVVTPIWEEEKISSEGDLVIKIDPGMAFGSGTHETTSMCIKLLSQYVGPESDVIDVGCGSGILAIAASKLGAKHVVGVDLDENAVKVAKENVAHNDLKAHIDIKHGDLLQNIEMKADVVVANILANVIILLTDDIKRLIKEEGVFISSGIINDKIDDVTKKLVDSGFEVMDVLRDGEWAAIVAKLRSE
jgi:ribosomal protein L11 methyltransferase